ncbi:MAG TPA: DUF58 domain-containing protein [Pseudogracilibacillus sp.]|nr:DUF58 domain-containing protein [Pseudogracilibacillus sp.]
MLQSRIFGIIWVVFSIFFFIFDDSYLGLLLLILTGVLIFLLILNIFLLKNKVLFDLKTEGIIFKNELGRLMIEVKNNSILPISKVTIYLEFENKLTNELGTKKVSLSINSRESVSLPLDVSSQYCGQIQVSVNQVRYYDFLGILTRELEVSSVSQLFVLPETYPINIMISDSNLDFVESSSYEINNRGTDGLEMFGIKKYSHEDNLNHIHWKLTSKFDELIVKELTETVNDTFLILIDLTIENEKSKNHPAVIDAMMDTFISTSEALLAEGYEHSIGWLNKEAGVVQIEGIYSIEQLTFSLKQILSLEQTESKSTLLDKFVHSDIQEHFSHVVYLTSEKREIVSIEKLPQTKITELICHLENNSINMDRNYIYTPKTMNDDLYELLI